MTVAPWFAEMRAWYPPVPTRFAHQVTLAREFGGFEDRLARRLPVSRGFELHLSDIYVKLLQGNLHVRTVWELIGHAVPLLHGAPEPEIPNCRRLRVVVDQAIALAAYHGTGAWGRAEIDMRLAAPALMMDDIRRAFGIPAAMFEPPVQWMPVSPPEPKTLPDRRARQLLLRHLTAAQAQDWAEASAFVCAAPSGRRYLVKRQRHINVVELNRGDPDKHWSMGELANCARWCYVVAQCPLDDQLLAQKLLIEGDEAEFRRVALAHLPPGAPSVITDDWWMRYFRERMPG